MDSAKAVSLLVGNGGQFQRVHPASDRRRTGHPAKRRLEEGPGRHHRADHGRHRRRGHRPGCGVFDPETGIKLWAGGPHVRPDGGAVRPGPDDVDAAAGHRRHRLRRALAGRSRASLTLAVNPYADTLLLTAIEAIGQNLPKAFANGAEHGGPGRRCSAPPRWSGRRSRSAGLIHVHTFAEVLGDLTHLPHGRLIGLMLPHVLEWVAPAAPRS